MRRLLYFLFAAVQIILWLGRSPTFATLGQQNSIQRIIDRGKLVVGVCQTDNPPFYERDDAGNLSGIDIEIAKGLADVLGVPMEINGEAKNWDGIVDQLEKKTIDLGTSFLSKLASRAKSIAYSRTYVRNRQGLLLDRLRVNHAGLRGLNTLKQIFSKESKEKLLTYTGSAYIKFAKEMFPDVDLVTFETEKEILNALMSGKYIGFLSDQLDIKMILAKTPDLKINLMPIALKGYNDFIAIGCNQDDTELLGYVNTYLEERGILIDIDSLKINQQMDLKSCL